MLRLNDWECPECLDVTEELTHETENVICFKCMKDRVKLPPIFRINKGPVPIGGYYDDNLQTFIRTKAHRQSVMDEQGVSERGATPKNGTVWI